MMIYMQDEYPDGWCIYDETGRLFSGLEEDTACIIVSKMNALRAEVARLREALATACRVLNDINSTYCYSIVQEIDEALANETPAPEVK